MSGLLRDWECVCVCVLACEVSKWVSEWERERERVRKWESEGTRSEREREMNTPMLIGDSTDVFSLSALPAH